AEPNVAIEARDGYAARARFAPTGRFLLRGRRTLGVEGGFGGKSGELHGVSLGRAVRGRAHSWRPRAGTDSNVCRAGVYGTQKLLLKPRHENWRHARGGKTRTVTQTRHGPMLTQASGTTLAPAAGWTTPAASYWKLLPATAASAVNPGICIVTPFK